MVLIVLIALATAFRVAAMAGNTLPTIGPAPSFSLTREDGSRLSLRELRGKVVAITFLYTECTDSCPLLTAKMVTIQSRLGDNFGSKVFFISITVDPERDNPEVLRRYAQTHGANSRGWAFLTGPPAEIHNVVRRYGLYAHKMPRGDVDHTFLTSLVDQTGTLRVQYLGTRFVPEELLHDLQILLREGGQ